MTNETFKITPVCVVIMNECEVKRKHANMVNALSVEDSKLYMCMKADRPVMMVFKMK